MFIDHIAVDHIRMEFEMAVDDVRPTFTWNGNTYPCTYGSTTVNQQFVIGGMTIDIGLTIRVRVASNPDYDDAEWDFSQIRPEKGDQVIFDGETRKIGRVTLIHGQLISMELDDMTM